LCNSAFENFPNFNLMLFLGLAGVFQTMKFKRTDFFAVV
jgi:hypothetical protein